MSLRKEEYNGKIHVSKDTMLFVVNSVFNKGIKDTITKENILKLMPDIDDDIEFKKFMTLFTEWYNNSPQYMLGGYSPIEFREIFK